MQMNENCHQRTGITTSFNANFCCVVHVSQHNEAMTVSIITDLTLNVKESLRSLENLRAERHNFVFSCYYKHSFHLMQVGLKVVPLISVLKVCLQFYSVTVSLNRKRFIVAPYFLYASAVRFLTN